MLSIQGEHKNFQCVPEPPTTIKSLVHPLEAAASRCMLLFCEPFLTCVTSVDAHAEYRPEKNIMLCDCIGTVTSAYLLKLGWLLRSFRGSALLRVRLVLVRFQNPSRTMGTYTLV